MIRFYSAILILCLFTTTQSQITSTSDDYDCDIPPPLAVEPLTCCRVSKPFDRINFPECFADSTIVTSTSTLPPIPVSEDFDDFSTLPSRPKSQLGNKNTFIPIKSSASNSREKDDDNNNRRGDDNDDNDDDNNNNKDDRNNGHDNEENDDKKNKHHGWRGKYHWGYDRHFHGDYHRYGRHRRQAIFRATPTTQYQCAIECIFNQTNILTNGRFDRDIALEVYADYYPEVPTDLLTRTIDRCTKQLRNYQIARRRRSRNQINRNLPIKKCRNGSGLFAACFNREVYRNCPSELDTNSDDCTTLRTFIDNCSPVRAARLNFSYDSVDVDQNGNFIPQD